MKSRGVLPDEVPVPVMDQTEEKEVISIAKNHLQKTAEKLPADGRNHHPVCGRQSLKSAKRSSTMLKNTTLT